MPLVDGQPLVVIDAAVVQVGEIAAIIILFVAGMQTTPREFLKLGAPSFAVGALGVVVPFFAGYFVLSALLGVPAMPAIIVATALTATSIAISVQVLNELGRLGSREGRLILGAAVADDVLGIAVLSVVLTMVNMGAITADIPNITFLLLPILGIYGAILAASVVLLPRLLDSQRLWGQYRGSTEVAATAACFGRPLAHSGGLCGRHGRHRVQGDSPHTRVRRKAGRLFCAPVLCDSGGEGRPARRQPGGYGTRRRADSTGRCHQTGRVRLAL
ncbi:MAG: hypothetical protein C4292_04365, partial [Nitrososphaera sp.]